MLKIIAAILMVWFAYRFAKFIIEVQEEKNALRRHYDNQPKASRPTITKTNSFSKN